ncbi:MAG TPA: hypothetical protein VEV44_13770 [Pseudoneobacillus sp.]|nr:hypothetical protein [Pseudoneobacillus sp.]
MNVVYEKSFDANEWMVIISLIICGLAIWLMPKIFTLLEGCAHFIYGFFIGMFYDHTISVKPWDYYDVNDSSAYQFMDFLSYIMYGPYGYFFIYFYKKINVKGFWHIPYVIIWSTFSLLMEWMGHKLGLFHYEKGYKMHWSIPIYLLAQTIQIIYYHIIKSTSASV